MANRQFAFCLVHQHCDAGPYTDGLLGSIDPGM
jgi:hypothetical protein